MIRIENHMGLIEVSNNYFASLVGHAASECFGVAGLANRTPVQGMRSLLFKRDDPDKGVKVCIVDGELYIDLYIIVTYGLNIAAIVKSIVHKVSYTVEAACGMNVAKVNVFVADMKVRG